MSRAPHFTSISQINSFPTIRATVAVISLFESSVDLSKVLVDYFETLLDMDCKISNGAQYILVGNFGGHTPIINNED
jgi:hypothetical protein